MAWNTRKQYRQDHQAPHRCMAQASTFEVKALGLPASGRLGPGCVALPARSRRCSGARGAMARAGALRCWARSWSQLGEQLMPVVLHGHGFHHRAA